MGCVLCSLGSFVSVVLDALERISFCTVCAMLTCCLLFTIITVMALGIGIGFNYCHVETTMKRMEMAAKAAGAWKSRRDMSGSKDVLRSVTQVLKSNLIHRVARREADVLFSASRNVTFTMSPDINNTMYNFTNTSKTLL